MSASISLSMRMSAPAASAVVLATVSQLGAPGSNNGSRRWRQGSCCERAAAHLPPAPRWKSAPLGTRRCCRVLTTHLRPPSCSSHSPDRRPHAAAWAARLPSWRPPSSRAECCDLGADPGGRPLGLAATGSRSPWPEWWSGRLRSSGACRQPFRPAAQWTPTRRPCRSIWRAGCSTSVGAPASASRART